MIIAVLIVAPGILCFRQVRAGAAPRSASWSRAAVQSATAAGDGCGCADKSIAVLPFENLSDEKSNAYFAEGIQDEILTRLSKIGALRVISRTSTQQYASKPGNLSEIARQLGVANIVEGSVQKAGDAVRVNVQLIRAATDVHLWAEIYDRKLDNLFTVQSEVAGAIASQLQATLTGDEKKALAAPLTTNAQAHDAWLRAVVYFNRGGEDPQGDELAIQQLTEATRIDPGFAAAWALLSRSHGSQYFQQYDHSDARKALAKAALDHAVQLAPDTTETRTAVGYYQYWVERDFAGRDPHVQRDRSQGAEQCRRDLGARLHRAPAGPQRRGRAPSRPGDRTRSAQHPAADRGCLDAHAGARLRRCAARRRSRA